MNYRRFVLIIFTITVIATIGSFCSCSNRKENIVYNALEVGNYDSEDGGLHTSDYSLWTPEVMDIHEDATASKRSVVTFCEKDYEGEYVYSVVSAPNMYKSHYYEGNDVAFEINASTGELVSFWFYQGFEQNSTISQDECLKIADSFARQYIDPTEYHLDVDTREIHDNYLSTFTFCKIIEGYETTDCLMVSIDGNGKVNSFQVLSINSFENEKRVTINKENISQAIEDKLRIIYSAKTETYTYEIKHQRLVKMNDGSIAVYCTISNSFTTDTSVSGSLINLLLVPESN